MFDLINQIINERYRTKGYMVLFLTFKNKPTYGVRVYENDKIIESDITFEEHITPIGKDEDDKNSYQYTSNEYIHQLVGEFEELIVCGFHAQDCVMRVADYFYAINNRTIIDEELTDFLSVLSNRFYFNSERYNLANRLTYDKAEDMLMYNKPLVTKFKHYVDRYEKPYFHVKQFESDFTLEECMKRLVEIEETKKHSRGIK